MHKFVRELITEWRRLELPFEGATFVVGVSGGADSVALLLALNELAKAEKLQNRFVACHFNHKLRGDEADADEEFVRFLAGEHKIELAVGHAHLPSEGNLEQNARKARYQFLSKTAETIGAQGVLTAHTLNDQAETFLMNLIRGAGPDGLGGMHAVREMPRFETPETSETPCAAGASGTRDKLKHIETSDVDDGSPLLPFSEAPLLLVRPLLNWARRSDTEAYCRAREVEYRYDSMNEDLNFTRVRIRKLLLPMLEEFNPKIVETLANTAQLLQDAAVRPLNENDEPVERGNSGELSLMELKSLERPDLYRILRQWLANKRGNTRGLSLKHIEAIERLALSRKSGRTVELPGGFAVVKTDGKLVYTDLKVEKSPSGN